jgi:hypothetical protein
MTGILRMYYIMTWFLRNNYNFDTLCNKGSPKTNSILLLASNVRYSYNPIHYTTSFSSIFVQFSAARDPHVTADVTAQQKYGTPNCPSTSLRVYSAVFNCVFHMKVSSSLKLGSVWPFWTRLSVYFWGVLVSMHFFYVVGRIIGNYWCIWGDRFKGEQNGNRIHRFFETFASLESRRIILYCKLLWGIRTTEKSAVTEISYG